MPGPRCVLQLWYGACRSIVAGGSRFARRSIAGDALDGAASRGRSLSGHRVQVIHCDSCCRVGGSWLLRASVRRFNSAVV